VLADTMHATDLTVLPT